MSCLKEIANQGVTILVVIHQPRMSIFKDFDNLILLARGGKGVFVGKREDVLPYFKGLGYNMLPHSNPADFILDVIQGELDEKNDSDAVSSQLLPQMWQTKRSEYQMAQNESIAVKTGNADYKSRKTASWLKQSYMTMKRGLVINTRQRITILSEFSHYSMYFIAQFPRWLNDF